MNATVHSRCMQQVAFTNREWAPSEQPEIQLGAADKNGRTVC